MIHYPSSSILELIKRPGIIDGALLANPSSKLSKVNDVIANATFITEDPSYEANHREGTNDLVSKTGNRILVLHVSSNRDSTTNFGRVLLPCGVNMVVAKKE